MKLKTMVRYVGWACEMIGWEWRQQQAAKAAAAAQVAPNTSATTTA